MPNHRTNNPRIPAPGQAPVLRWLLLLITSCSFKSLDYLQGGERPGDDAVGGTTSVAGAGTTTGGLRSIGNSGSTFLATSETNVSAGRSGISGQSGMTSTYESTGGASSTYSSGRDAAGSGGVADVTSTTSQGGIIENGGQPPASSSANSSSVGGMPAHAGGEGTQSSALAGSAGVLGEAIGGRSFGGQSAGGQSVGGQSATLHSAGSGGKNYGGAAGATGGAVNSTMVYDVPGQSCGSGLSCATGTSCCNQFGVPSGMFNMGTNSDSSRNGDESPPHSATLDGFKLDQFEVTVGRFRNFVVAFDGTTPPAGSGAHPRILNSGWQVGYDANLPVSRSALQSIINCSTGQYQTFTEAVGVREAMPMNCVNWYVAFAFCIWDGGRLPTEAEWEMAASNGSNETRFPWGAADPEPAKHAVMNCLGDQVSGCSPNDLPPVGSRPDGANQWGHLDLAGSLWEWTLDYYDSTYYQAIGTCPNCANLAGTTPRVIRGGNFTSTLVSVRATGRASKSPNVADPYAGFRCARNL